MAEGEELVRSESQVDAAVLEHLYARQGLSLTEVAQRLDLSPTTVADRLERRGIPRRATGWAPKGGLSRAGEGAEVSCLYAEGMRAAEVAERLGRSQTWVEARARELGCAPGRGFRRAEVTAEEVEQQYRVEESSNGDGAGQTLLSHRLFQAGAR